MGDLKKLEDLLLQPSADLIEDLKNLEDDILILGVGGKMGPSLALLAKQALQKAGKTNRVIGVSRFSSENLEQDLNKKGIETIKADLLNEKDLEALPDVRNVIYMAGTKFGTQGNESFTWAMNAYLPGRIASKFKHSNIVVFSTGNVYPLVPLVSGGATESVQPGPVGEYAQSCLGRERVFEHFSKINKTPMLIYRLNYAVDFRYGVLVEIAKSVRNEEPIDLSTGHVNVIWQSDANEYALRSLKHCKNPMEILNITGPETVSIRWLANEFGLRFGKKPHFIKEEQSTALLNNASQAHKLFGYPKVSLQTIIDATAMWLEEGGALINKPTHFQERKGNY
ncbi:NAD-dependent epimerase/dehydratase family protein [Flexithrix dorotheae]|uniref:NAD-dependent epimerase/dehydratase family protein n=1 Tax=Flexithrix dorotheae TaxID=70993 RepID=UPI00037BD13D|nr:NAD-dependent epimerase/dehydratase family protein [Flexithrix dorotheae]